MGDEYFTYQNFISLFSERHHPVVTVHTAGHNKQQEGFTQGRLYQKQTSCEIRVQKLSSALQEPSPLGKRVTLFEELVY